MQSIIGDYIYTRKEAAKYIKGILGYGTEKTLAYWECKKKGKLKSRKFGGYRVRYRKCDLDQFIQKTLDDLFNP